MSVYHSIRAEMAESKVYTNSRWLCIQANRIPSLIHTVSARHDLTIPSLLSTVQTDTYMLTQAECMLKKKPKPKAVLGSI